MKKLVIASSRKYGQKVADLSQVMFSLLDPQGFRASFSRIMWLAVMLATGQRIGRVNARTRRFNHIIQIAFRMAQNHGVKTTISWLKACHVALMRYIGGSPLSSLRKVDSSLPFYRLSNGLPVCIGTSDRKAIRKGDIGVIRLYMTIFGLYRILSSPLNPKLNTISDPCGAKEEGIEGFNSYLDQFLLSFAQRYNLRLYLRPQNGRLPFSTSAGPNTHNGMSAFLADARVVWYSHLRDTMIEYAQLAGLTKWIGWLQYCTTTADQMGALSMPLKASASSILEEGIPSKDGVPYFESLGEVAEKQDLATRPMTPEEIKIATREAKAKRKLSKDPKVRKKRIEITPHLEETYLGIPAFVQGALGQLSFKVEAAGKLRVFAIVDIWTQWLLSGLHESIMSSLKRIPMDGTKDHNACAERAGLKGKEFGAWSVDISSATDRVPILIQKSILNKLFGCHIGDLWAKILTDRSFRIPENDHGIEPGSIRYNTGQPMGARSSWPMLALTHHLLVQWAAWKVGISKDGTFFEDYEVIGDDLVIHDYHVYLQYLQNAELLDYGISEAKSLPSPNVGAIEMAKKIMLGHVSLSSVALKQLLASMKSLSGRVQNVLYFSKLGLVSGPSVILGILSRSKSDYLKSLQKYSVGKANSLICLLTAALGPDRLAESVEFLAEPRKRRTGQIPVQRILLFVEQLLLDGDGLIEPNFYSVLDAQNIVHALVHKIVGQVRARYEKLVEEQGSYYQKFATKLLAPLAPGRVYTKVALLQNLPIASFVLRLEEDLPELEEQLKAFEAKLDEWSMLPTTAVSPRMVSLPRVRKVTSQMLAEALGLLDEVIQIENRANLYAEPRQFTHSYGWLIGALAPLARAQKAARTAVNIAGRPKSRWIGTW